MLRDNTLVIADSLRTAHIEELEMVRDEEENKLVVTWENAISKFTSDLEVLAVSIFVFGFTKIVDEVSPLLSTK